MPSSTAGGSVTLDHVAHAARHWRDLWERYASDLGAEWVSGGQNRGFAPGQVRFGNGARIEMLMPWEPQHDNFLVRFLDRSGPGAHHLTFKVRDIRAALAEARRAGFDPIGVDLSQPEWMEAFLHPKEATGVVVQLAESSHDEDAGSWATPPPVGFPSERRRRHDGSGPIDRSTLEWVVHAVAEPDVARSLFVGLLGGTTVHGGAAGGVAWMDIAWSGPLGVRLLWASATPPEKTGRGSATIDPHPGFELADELVAWLGGRSGRIHHLELRVEDPADVPDAVAVQDPLCRIGHAAERESWEVPALANQGLRLVLSRVEGSDAGPATQDFT